MKINGIKLSGLKIKMNNYQFKFKKSNKKTKLYKEDKNNSIQLLKSKKKRYKKQKQKIVKSNKLKIKFSSHLNKNKNYLNKLFLNSTLHNKKFKILQPLKTHCSKEYSLKRPLSKNRSIS